MRDVQHRLSSRISACLELVPYNIAFFCRDFLKQRPWLETLQPNRSPLVITTEK